MKVTIRGKNKTHVSERDKAQIEDKIKKLDQYFRDPNAIEANVLCKEYEDCKALEITIPTKHLLLRAEVKEENFPCAMDAAMAKLEGQLRRHKSKIDTSIKRREGVSGYYDSQSDFDLESMQAELMANSLVKDKKIDLVPMTVDEALMQMDLLDHKFFIFLNSETNKVCVVYLREDHDYGIIETNM